MFSHIHTCHISSKLSKRCLTVYRKKRAELSVTDSFMFEKQLLFRMTLRGVLHRKNGPASISYINNVAISESWYKNGKKHRIGGPAVILRHENGKKNIEEWFENGVQHRINGPASIIYEKERIRNNWFIYGEHKLYTLVFILKDENGDVNFKEWIEHDIKNITSCPASVLNEQKRIIDNYTYSSKATYF